MPSRSPLARNRNPCALGLVLILALAACKDIADPSTDHPFAPNPVTAAGAQQALACGAAHGLPIKRPVASIRLYLADSLPNGLGDYGRGSSAIVLTVLKDAPQVWAHIYLHLLYGLPGMSRESHPPIFARCGLLDL